MIKYLFKKKIKNEVEKKGKKVLIYTGVVLTGVGVYISYKAIKNNKLKKELQEEEKYLKDSEYEIYNYEVEKQQETEEEEQLKEKVEEFNSKRINCENCEHVSKQDLEKFVEEVKDTKADIEINTDDYKEEEYEKYDYYEDDLSK